ncbi:tyrosine-type recombinase/integrase [Spirosoma linguale]|uniref:Integrase family protein n=1 Tax=Spirosoma linguale (strain ATCC 33905 / DSM 74 / LMG 10896 / Claus 1) TaxID=504472 RepID=D2QVG8_SPILD|nr:integrase family protein [Spirosoma linguale DSM 74]
MSDTRISIRGRGTNELTILPTKEELAGQTAAFFQKGLEGAANSQTAYVSDIEHLESWLAQHSLPVLPLTPATLATYLSDLATRHKWATVSRRLATIRKWHRLHKHPDPSGDEAVKIVLDGIKRSIGTEPDQAAAFDITAYKDRIRNIPATPSGVRDRALLLVCFAGAFRRSELVALNVEGVQFTRDGAVLTYQGSKTNQYGKTEQKALFFSPDPDTCPVRALQDYINLLDRQIGPLFVRIRKGEQITTARLSDKQVARTTKEYIGDEYSAHSHRASFVTIAKLNGADDSQIMQQTKHRTRTMIDRYTRVQQIVKHNAAMKLGL